MKLSEYSYNLPESCIAKYPPKIRGSSKLLVLNRDSGEMANSLYKKINHFLNYGDTLVINDTKVIKARLLVKNEEGKDRELLILEKHQFDEDWRYHRVLYRGKIKNGEILTINKLIKLKVESIEPGGVANISCDKSLLNLAETYGKVPLPPYIKRPAESNDEQRYQTIWARDSGSVAAPTASLNMTDDIITTLKREGVNIVYLTLHVGLGTFLPIRTNFIDKHKMHREYFNIPKSTVDVIKSTKKSKKRVFALGTTVARALEYSADLIYKTNKEISGEADIFIHPGYEFKIVDGLVTNFHAPKSTVLMLASAFAGWDKLSLAYKYAIEHGYKLLSYGDSMLIW